MAPTSLRRQRDRVWPAVAAIFALVAALVLLWLDARGWDDRTATTTTRLGAASSISALVGTLLLSITLVLSARLRLVESAAGGLDRVYRLHHWLGTAAFALLALHPTLLAWRAAQVSWEAAAALWRPTADDWVLTAGQVALYAMTVGMILTVYARLRHQTTVWIQRLLGATFLVAGYHVLRTTGDVANADALRAFMIVVVIAGLAALVYHTLLGRFVTRHYGYEVLAVTPLGVDVTEVRLRARRRAVPFVPGQFAFLRFRHEPVGGEPHPFSFASPPGGHEARFVIKDLGDYTHHIGEVHVGAQAVIEGPYGRFSHRFVTGRNQVWIGGGIGIAPFLSMAASLPARGYDVDLFYAFPDAEHAPFLPELEMLAATRPNLRVHPFSESADGLLDADRIMTTVEPEDDREFLLCGPAEMMHALRRQLAARQVPHRRIHFEEFEYA